MKHDHLAAIREFIARIESGGVSMERNDATRFHKLAEAGAAGRVLNAGSGNPIEGSATIGKMQHTFVVKHDWASVLAGSVDPGDQIILPYDTCSFEFRLNGATVIALASIEPDVNDIPGSGLALLIHVMQGDVWLCFRGASTAEELAVEDRLAAFIRGQIRAICVALDAEVAVHDVIRAPHKLNEKRLAANKPPLLDYHVVDLAKRHRASANPYSEPSGRKVRLHFRRGHWRHYEGHKTWIKWMLVGNPDLGFIQKEYSL